MFGKKSYLKTLESRKQALLAESDFNRIELLKDWDALKVETNRVKKHLRNVGSIASSAALLATAAAFFRRRPEAPKARENHAHTNASWVNAALNGARVGASLFLRLKSFLRERRR
jgi:hypothetical protein